MPAAELKEDLLATSDDEKPPEDPGNEGRGLPGGEKMNQSVAFHFRTSEGKFSPARIGPRKKLSLEVIKMGKRISTFQRVDPFYFCFFFRRSPVPVPVPVALPSGRPRSQEAKGLATKRSELLQEKPIVPNTNVESKIKVGSVMAFVFAAIPM